MKRRTKSGNDANSRPRATVRRKKSRRGCASARRRAAAWCRCRCYSPTPAVGCRQTAGRARF